MNFEYDFKSHNGERPPFTAISRGRREVVARQAGGGLGVQLVCGEV